MKNIRSSHGFSLIQMLLGIVLLGMLGLGFADLIKNMWLHSHSVQTKNNEINLFRSISAQLATEKSCTASLLNKSNFDPTQAVRPIVINYDGTVISADAIVNAWGLKVDRFNLTNVNLAITSVNGRSTYIGSMQIQAEGLSQETFSYKNKDIGKLFLVVNDATKMIESCYAVEDFESIVQQVCASIGGTLVGNTCSLNQLRQRTLASIGSCGTGEVLTGLKANGDRNCEAPKNKLAGAGSCPPGTTVGGFNSAGSIVCNANPASPPAPPPRVCASTSSRNCCPGNSGSCVVTGTVTEHDPSGGMGGNDVIHNNYTCFCQ